MHNIGSHMVCRQQISVGIELIHLVYRKSVYTPIVNASLWILFKLTPYGSNELTTNQTKTCIAHQRFLISQHNPGRTEQQNKIIDM